MELCGSVCGGACVYCEGIKMNIARELLRVARILSAAGEEPVKYPRTPHLPWSPGFTEDDIVLERADMFEGKDVVITEKMDGENTTLYFDHIHARSTSSKSHPSRDWVKGMWSKMKHNIPQGMRVVGENIFATHSIEYDKLPTFFLVFAVFDGDTCLSWNETVDWCNLLDLQHVPVLYQGKWDKDKAIGCFSGKSCHGGSQEGYVVRNAGSFSYSAFKDNVAKWVRKGHVQEDSDHWMHKTVKPNKMVVEIPENP